MCREKTCSCVCNSFSLIRFWAEFELSWECERDCVHRFYFVSWVLLNKQWMTLSGDGNQIVEWTRWQLSEAYQKVWVCVFCVVFPMFKFIEMSIFESWSERETEIQWKSRNERNKRKKTHITESSKIKWQATSVSDMCNYTHGYVGVFTYVKEYKTMMQMNKCKIYASPRKGFD